MRVFAIGALILVILGGVGFFYLLHVADQMEPPPSEQRIDVDVSLPG